MRTIWELKGVWVNLTTPDDRRWFGLIGNCLQSFWQVRAQDDHSKLARTSHEWKKNPEVSWKVSKRLRLTGNGFRWREAVVWHRWSDVQGNVWNPDHRSASNGVATLFNHGEFIEIFWTFNYTSSKFAGQQLVKPSASAFNYDVAYWSSVSKPDYCLNRLQIIF